MPGPAALLTTVLAGPLTEVQVGPAMRAPVVLRAEVRAVLDTTVREARHIEDPVEPRTTAQEGQPIAGPVGLAMLAQGDPAIQVRVAWLNAALRFAVARRCLRISRARQGHLKSRETISTEHDLTPRFSSSGSGTSLAGKAPSTGVGQRASSSAA